MSVNTALVLLALVVFMASALGWWPIDELKPVSLGLAIFMVSRLPTR